jgi:lysophospholipase L1-like esterase
MKKILLLGDSIRMGYQPFVTKLLEGRAEVVAPSENCRFVKYTLWNVNSWIDELGIPDIIHWNNGIWDVFRLTQNMGIFTNLDEYMRDLERVYNELVKTGAKIIWATTTPVSDKFASVNNSDVDLYNEKALEFMNNKNIEINDLHYLLRSKIESKILDDFLHLNDDGLRICADAIVSKVEKYL